MNKIFNYIVVNRTYNNTVSRFAVSLDTILRVIDYTPWKEGHNATNKPNTSIVCTEGTTIYAIETFDEVLKRIDDAQECYSTKL